MKTEDLKKRLAKDRPVLDVTLRIPEDVVEDLKRIAPLLGFSGYLPLARHYIGQGSRADLARLDDGPESKRSIGQEILGGIREIKRGGGIRREVGAPNATVARMKSGLSQDAFAALLGVTVRTLRDWEQGRRKPRGPASALLRVAERHPEALTG